jgi:hypothetical protein
MARETVMIEIEEPITSSDGKPATPAQEADFIRAKLAGTALACTVRAAPIPNADRVLVDVEDPSRDIVDLVTDKLNDAGVSAFVYLFDNETNAVTDL